MTMSKQLGLAAAVVLLLSLLGAAGAPASPPVRVALMDFSTDDNSWRNAQAAANFTSLVQTRLGKEPGVEWVERAQLDLARQELKLSEMELLSGASPIRRGKWAKADWLIQGHFSLDDKNQRTLSLEITDLQHADVLASQTIVFPGDATPEIQSAQDQVQLAASTVHQLLAAARRRHDETRGQVLVAPLFMVDVSRFGFSQGEEVLEPEFYAALEHAAATNKHLRLIRFPKAYQATDESEMVLDGLVQADPQAWLHVADLYVWGTYAVTNTRTAGTVKSRLEITLNLWDGASPPDTIGNAVTISGYNKLPSGQMVAILDRMVEAISARAHRSEHVAVSLATRQEVAESIAQAYRQLTGPMRPRLGPLDERAFLQAVHLLETACFFDPDNAELQAMRICCRWGFWIDSGFDTKSWFWSCWRRTRAWGWYVGRFGLQPTATPLPFPYNYHGLPELYVRSQQVVLERFPERYELDDERQQAAGVFTPLMEAQAHGFPKDIPRDVVLKWKAEVEAELAQRKKKVAALAQSTAATAGSTPVTLPNRPAPPPSNQPPVSSVSTVPSNSASKAMRSVRGPSLRNQIVAAPGWLKALNDRFSAFSLSPPNVPTPEIKPVKHTYQFPPQFEVQGVLQMALWQGKLLLLALDERSAPSSEARPDMASEVISQRARLWILDPAAQQPALFEPGLLPDNIQSFLFDQEKLWVAGASVGCLDLRNRSFHQFGLRDGLASGRFESLTSAGGRLFVTGDVFKLFSLESGASQWQQVDLPKAKFYAATSCPSRVSGNARWLAYVSGAAFLYDVSAATWTNLPDMALLDCVAADASGFWFGGFEGLHRYDLDSRSFSNMPAPTNIRGLSPFSMGPYQFLGQPRVPQEAITSISDSIERFLNKLQMERTRVHLGRAQHKDAIDPLHLDWRMRGHITALAHDGEFLWLGTGRSTGGRLLLIHKPSLSLVGCCPTDGDVSSLTVTEHDLWLGTSYRKDKLTRIEKQPLLSIPRSQWLSLQIAPEERTRLVNNMGVHDRAMYAFYAGDDARVVELLGNVNPDKASLEEMFQLAFAYDTIGVVRPEQSRQWFERIISRNPDSPWATAARECIEANDEQAIVCQRQNRLLAKYDRNHDGVLDPSERQAMEKDPEYQRETEASTQDQLESQLRAIFKRFDANGDGLLDQNELERLRRDIFVYSEFPPKMLIGWAKIVAPLLTKNLPVADRLLWQYDTNRDGALDVGELKALANDIQKRK